MASDTQNVKLGVCKVYFDGVDLGYTKGGVEVEVVSETHKVQVDQFGKTPIGERILGRQVTVKVPLVETTLDNLVRTMPGASLVATGGARATGTVTFATAVPANNDVVVIGGYSYTFKTAPTPGNIRELAIPATFTLAAQALKDAVNFDSVNPVTASGAAAVITLTADNIGTGGNAITLTKTGTNITVSGATLTGGTNPSAMKVSVNTGIGIDLLAQAKELVLHPKERTDGDKSEDFVIPLAATSGGLTFAYKLEDERIFNVTFTAYPNPTTDELFIYGNKNAA